MGLFDSFAKQAMGGLFGGSAFGSGLDLGALMRVFSDPTRVREAISEMIEHVGGLSGLREKLQRAGLGPVVDSWVGTGDNVPVQAAQMENAFGAGTIEDFAAKLGLDSKQIPALLAQFLPGLIDKLTPQGQIENDHPSSDALQNAIASVIKDALGGFGGRKPA